MGTRRGRDLRRATTNAPSMFLDRGQGIVERMVRRRYDGGEGLNGIASRLNYKDTWLCFGDTPHVAAEQIRQPPTIAVRHCGYTNIHFAQPFDFEGTSLRKSRNSFGPLISRRFRLARSSADDDGSKRLSIVRAAKSADLFRPAGTCGCNPASIHCRIASDLLVPCLAAHLSTAFTSSAGRRSAVTGSRPVAGRPGPRFGITFFLDLPMRYLPPRCAAAVIIYPNAAKVRFGELLFFNARLFHVASASAGRP